MTKLCLRIIKVLYKNLGYKKIVVNANKIYNRIYDKLIDNRKVKNKKNLNWIKNNVIDIKNYAVSIDANLWEETMEFFNKFEENSIEILKEIKHKVGGGGAYHLLYFLTRKYQPNYIVETGVATGFTSSAILEALEINKSGYLFSSDYPYPFLTEDENYLGILVDERLKKRWMLHCEGDEFNLKKIPDLWKGKVDIFHYDSSKWYKDKKRCMQTISQYLSKKAFIIFDDIQDDLFFYDLVNKNNYSNFQIIEFKNKYLGLIKINKLM